MGLFNKDKDLLMTADQVYAADQTIRQAQSLPQLDPLSAAQINNLYRDDQMMESIPRLTLDNRRIIEEFRERLRGYLIQREYDMNTGEELEPKIIKFGEPLMNQEGINHLTGLLESFLSKSIMLSNYPEQMYRQINVWCDIFWRTIAVQIAINSEKWNVDRSRRDSLCSEMTLLLQSNMLRAFEDGERKKVYPTQRTTTTQMLSGINPASIPQKKTFFGL